ncbi:hypothetical protein F4804DRAFT_350120 [Jackrogersella minutella]|nr:hypothetical protein F4804DRAFT_350120 [Jackrogersella minutella]
MAPDQLEALLNGPALAPPPGVIPQLENFPSYSVAGRSITIVCIAVATLAIAMRFYTRIRILHQICYADCNMCSYYGDMYAPRAHQWNIRLRNLGPFLYYVHIASVLYAVCILFIKVSILLQYIQVFLPAKKPKAIYWTVIVMAGTNALFYSTGIFCEIFACHPFAKAWDPFITQGHCIDTLALSSVSGGINTISDVIILILPQLIIWRLNISIKNKTAVSVIFLVAIFACISSGVRSYYAIVLQHHNDVTYYTWFDDIWGLVEMTSGIVVACLPVSKAFFSNLIQSRMFFSIQSSIKKLTSRPRSLNLSSVPGYRLEEHEHGHNQERAWVNTYGITGLNSLAESDSTTVFRMSDGFGAGPEEGKHKQQTEAQMGHDWLGPAHPSVSPV